MTDTMVLSLTIVGVLIVLLGILRLRHVSLQTLVLGLIGAIVGLLLGALASVPLSKLSDPFGGILPVAITVMFTLTAVVLVLSRRTAFLKLLPFLSIENTDASQAQSAAPADAPAANRVLVDTSVIIDGRIADIAEAGFVPGVLVVPRFVLAELQNIADSDDAMRRGRGRRGLEVLNRLRDMPDVTVEITEEDVSGIKEVDAKLVALAQRFTCNVLTTDYNLNRVAQIQGVRVLNVNELSNAIRPVVLPGEQLMVRVVQPGKERNQGVGYLADGTMIVVENGDKMIGQEVATEVTRVFQTVAGKMIFATPRKGVVVPEPKPVSAPPQAASNVPEPVAPVPAPAPLVSAESTKPPKSQQAAQPPASQPTQSQKTTSGSRATGPRANGNGRSRRQNNHRPSGSGDIEERLVQRNHGPQQ